MITEYIMRYNQRWCKVRKMRQNGTGSMKMTWDKQLMICQDEMVWNAQDRMGEYAKLQNEN